MAQGTRGRLLLAAATGFGIVLCTGLAGCQNTDKAKDTKVAAKQPGPYLPGTPRLDGTGTANKSQPYYGAPGSNIQQTGGSQLPGTGLGGGQQPSQPTQFGSSNGNNPLNTSVQPQNFGSNVPGTPGTIGAPAQNRMTYPPLGGGPVGLAPGATPNSGGSLIAGSPPPPLLDPPLLPPPPPNFGTSGGSVAVAPIAPAPIPPSLPTLGTGTGIPPKPGSTSGFSGAGILP